MGFGRITRAGSAFDGTRFRSRANLRTLALPPLKGEERPAPP